MDKPLNVWYCDVCNKPITNINEGIVIWESNDKLKDFNFKIIHKTIRNTVNGCDNLLPSKSQELKDFIGIHGLILLSGFLSFGKASNYPGGNNIKDMDEFVDFFRRVQLPFYEEARKYFKTAITQEFLHGASEIYPYHENILKQIIEKN